MKTWEAAPLIGINGVTFGMPRSKVHEVLGPHFNEFTKNKYSRNSSDDYGVAHIYYDEHDKCLAVEVFPEVEVSIAGNIVFPTSIDNAIEILDDLKQEDGGYVSVEKSIGISVLDGKMECILFGAEGYYE